LLQKYLVISSLANKGLEDELISDINVSSELIWGFILFNLNCDIHDENIRNLLHLKLFTYLDEDITLARRINRDIKERNKTFTKVIHEYQSYVKPAFISIIKPSMIYADMIISTSDTTDDTVYLDVICQYIKCKL
jgi:uridine kinase